MPCLLAVLGGASVATLDSLDGTPPGGAAAAPPLSATAGQVRVSCVGDSITQCACSSDCATKSYPAQLQQQLGSGYVVTNFGQSGQTMMRNGLCGNQKGTPPLPTPCDGNCSYWQWPAYRNAVASAPDVVTIMMGTNDAKWCNWFGAPNGAPSGNGTEFAAQFVEMIGIFKALPSRPRVLVAMPPPLVHHPRYPDLYVYNMSADVINTQFRTLQRDIARVAGAEVVDTWAALGGTSLDPALTCDGCHPKDDALGTMAATLKAAILAGPAPTPPAPPPTPSPSADGVWLYEAGSGGGRLFVPRSGFVVNAHRGGALAWDVCGGGSFDDGGPLWTNGVGSFVGSFQVSGGWALRTSVKCGLHYEYDPLPMGGKAYTAADGKTSFEQEAYLEAA